jgi:hypothetical protein
VFISMLPGFILLCVLCASVVIQATVL